MEEFLPEIPRFYTALAEWAACLIFILVMKRRVSGARLLLGTAGSFITILAFQLFAGALPVVFWVPSMVFAVLLMFLSIFMLCKLSVIDAAYCCIRAFLMAELAASFVWQLHCFFLYNKGFRVAPKIFMLLITYAFTFVLFYFLEKRFNPNNITLNTTPKELVGAVLIGIAAFIMSNISYTNAQTPFTVRHDSDLFTMRTLVDLVGLAILYIYYIQTIVSQTQRELEAVERMLEMQYSQYQLSKESMDLINLKYHDLKNQIAVIRAEINPVKQLEYLEEMEGSIKYHEAQYKTGNRVLDILLTNKSLICREHDIEFTCVANGSLLDFISTMDICNIIGNALDNAIECEMNIEDIEKRLIQLSLFDKKDFIMLRIENYYDGALSMQMNGIPLTTKKNKEYHGFGLKSIQYAVKNYQGTLIIEQNNNWVQLKILIPKQNNS